MSETKPTISLDKGVKVDLNKEAPGLTAVFLGLGWDTNSVAGGAAFDLDASAFLLNAEGKLADPGNFVYFKHLVSADGSVVHRGDNRTGVGDGDDETVDVALDKVPETVQQIVFVVNIYDATARRQNFGQVKNAFIRLVDKNSNAEILRYDLGEDYSSETGVLFGRLYRHNGNWKFEASGLGEPDGLAGFLAKYQ